MNSPMKTPPHYDPEWVSMMMAQIKTMHTQALTMIRFNQALAGFNIGLSLLLIYQLIEPWLWAD